MSNQPKVNQRTPSIWMILAIVQSILFLFYIPILCKKYWLVIFGRGLSNEMAEVSCYVHKICTRFFLTSISPVSFFSSYHRDACLVLTQHTSTNSYILCIQYNNVTNILDTTSILRTVQDTTK